MTKSDESSSDILYTKLFFKQYADSGGIPCVLEFARGIGEKILFLLKEI